MEQIKYLVHNVRTLGSYILYFPLGDGIDYIYEQIKNEFDVWEKEMFISINENYAKFKIILVLKRKENKRKIKRKKSKLDIIREFFFRSKTIK